MTLTNVKEKSMAWYLKNIPNPAEMDTKITATLEYVKRFNEPDEEGDWVVFAYEVVGGQHGQYTVRMFLNEIENTEQWMNVEDLDVLMEAFDEVSTELAKVFSKHTSLPGTFYVGNNEADGSLGVFYSVKA